MPFILNALLKNVCTLFSCWQLSIIKYIRIPDGFQSDNKKVYHLVFWLNIQFTSESNKKLCYTLHFYVTPSLLSRPQSEHS